MEGCGSPWVIDGELCIPVTMELSKTLPRSISEIGTALITSVVYLSILPLHSGGGVKRTER